MKYILIKCNDWCFDNYDYNTIKLAGNSYDNKVVELTEEELKHLIYFNNHSWCGNDSYKDLAKELDIKLRKVL